MKPLTQETLMDAIQSLRRTSITSSYFIIPSEQMLLLAPWILKRKKWLKGKRK